MTLVTDVTGGALAVFGSLASGLVGITFVVRSIRRLFRVAS